MTLRKLKKRRMTKMAKIKLSVKQGAKIPNKVKPGKFNRKFPKIRGMAGPRLGR
jgi:hypothetical protein